MKFFKKYLLISVIGPFAITGLAFSENRFPVDLEPLDRDNKYSLNSYADILENSQPAVVSVTTSRIVEIMRGRGVNPMEDFLRRFYGLPDQQTDPRRGREPDSAEPLERRVPNGLGSGVIISADGYVLTNNHVVSDDSGRPADEITVQLSDGTEIMAELIGRDRRTDVALIKIDREDLPYLTMANSDELRVGDIVFAIGNPLGIGQTSTMGIVSALGRTNLGILGTEGYENFIQTDAAINRGNSGGAMIDTMGRLVGINTAIASQTGGNIGIGFAIPITMARRVVLDLLDEGEVRRGYLGVSIRDLDRDFAEAFSLKSTDGALVEVVQEDGPAARSGIQRGDVIVEVEGRPIRNVSNLRLTIAGIRPGQDITVVVMREGEKVFLPVKLGSLDDPTASLDERSSPLDGVDLVALDDDLKAEWNIEESSGVLVTSVDVRSPYANALSVGMVILEANDHEVSTVSEFSEALISGRVNRLWLSLRGNRGYVAIRVP